MNEDWKENGDGLESEVFESKVLGHEIIDPVFKSKYREKMKRVLIDAGGYDGSNGKYKEMMKVFIAFEEWLKDVFGDGEIRLSEEKEIELYRRYYGKRGRMTVGDILDVADKNFRRRLSNNTESNRDIDVGEAGILTVSLPGVLLPSGQGVVEMGNGAEKFELRLQKRLNQLIQLLVRNGIFTDDIVVCRGKLDSTMMRKVSYVLVEIPKINKQVLVCDQVGEATFVVNGILSRDLLLSLSKEELLNRFGMKLKKIVYGVSQKWEADVLTVLFEDRDLESCDLVDLRDREFLRSQIMQMHSVEEWAAMNFQAKCKFEVCGMKLKALARRFGVQGCPVGNHAIHKELGQKIYGEGYDCLEVVEEREYSLQEIKSAILEKVPTAEKWAAMNRQAKRKFEVCGMKLIALARRFGVQGCPVGNHAIHKELGQKIYGEGYDCLKEYSLEEIKDEVLKKVPTAEKWAAMNQQAKSKFEVCGMKLIALARRFGVKGSPVGYHVIHKELGQKIYGEGYDCLEVVEEREYSLEEIKSAILEKVPTAEKWAAMNRQVKSKFEVCGMKLIALARRFGVKGNPVNYHAIHKELGQKIYGEGE